MRADASNALNMTLPSAENRRIAVWLLAVAVMIFCMIVLGGATRLTRSGLSIVEWRLFAGTLPPLTEAHWIEFFDLYKQTPEYLKVNAGMDLAGFKEIFWLEYLHRLWGRLIFLVALLPALWFLWRGKLAPPLKRQVLSIPLLVAANGVLGWLMVASGLVDIPRVSPYRLTAHLGFAVAIYGYLVWLALGLLASADSTASASLRRAGTAVTALIFLMILSGGLVAGTKAGFVFNTFPLMNGQFVPDGLMAMQPWWLNPLENMATVQFDHRLLAYLLLVIVPGYWWLARRADLAPRQRVLFHLMLAALVMQVLLGIATLVQIVPVALGVAHQAGALVLFTLALATRHTLRA